MVEQLETVTIYRVLEFERDFWNIAVTQIAEDGMCQQFADDER